MTIEVKRRQRRTQEAHSRGARAMQEEKRREAQFSLYQPKVEELEPAEPAWEPPPNPWSQEHLNYTEQGRILREDPALAEQFIQEARRGQDV